MIRKVLHLLHLPLFLLLENPITTFIAVFGSLSSAEEVAQLLCASRRRRRRSLEKGNSWIVKKATESEISPHR